MVSKMFSDFLFLFWFFLEVGILCLTYVHIMFGLMHLEISWFVFVSSFLQKDIDLGLKYIYMYMFIGFSFISSYEKDNCLEK